MNQVHCTSIIAVCARRRPSHFWRKFSTNLASDMPILSQRTIPSPRVCRPKNASERAYPARRRQSRHDSDWRFLCRAVAFEMNKTFAKTLIDNMERYSKPGASAHTDAGAREVSSEVSDDQPGADDKIRRVRGEVEQVKQVMTDNIDRILERGDKIDLLVDKSQDLSEQVAHPYSFLLLAFQTCIPRPPLHIPHGPCFYV